MAALPARSVRGYGWLVMGVAPYVVDPTDPRAPPEDVWKPMSEEERRRVVASLPSEIPRPLPLEGDAHRLANGARWRRSTSSSGAAGAASISDPSCRSTTRARRCSRPT